VGWLPAGRRVVRVDLGMAARALASV
jgi:hypothetical protein